MSEAKPTPGPWRSLDKDMFGDYTIVPADEGLAVAAVVTNLRQQGEVSANARLIAAAPELLEAAKRMVEVGFDGDFYTEEENEVMDMLEVAIAKAEGHE